MTLKRLAALAATVILLGLPVADFARDGEVADALVGALLVLACGGAGFSGDLARRALLRVLLPDVSPDDGTPKGDDE